MLEKIKVREIWSIALLKISDSSDFFNIANHKLIKSFSTKRFSIRFPSIICKADPFLIESNGNLFMFYEQVYRGGIGEIFMTYTSDLKKWFKPVRVLKEDFHLSYPNIFLEEGKYYMIPETGQTNSIRLYTTEEFPKKWKLLKTIIEGAKFVDTNILKHNNLFYLFTTEVITINKQQEYILKLFYSKELDGNWVEHPKSPISNALNNARCGGQIFELDGDLYRPAQNCEKSYGQNLSIFQIITLTHTDYEEKSYHNDIFNSKDKFFSQGGHHLSQIKFNGETILAVDGLKKEMVLNTLLQSIALKIKGK
jgi:beta-xylosidase